MDAIEKYIRSNRSRFINELVTYTSFPSVSAQSKHAPDLIDCADWLKNHCSDIGLESELYSTACHPILLARTPVTSGESKKPTFLVYGHYDVQPVEPLNLWKSDPFKPLIKGNHLYARGASDNKGQNFAHLKAVEAYLKTDTELPCNLIFLIEGEEEVGSANLSLFLKKQRKALECSAVVISDTGMPDLKHPALTYALRGVVACEVKIKGPNRDLHSGIFGGSVDNPAMVLCEMMAKLRNANGEITVPGFYEDVKSLSAFERKQMARIPHDDVDYARFLGVKGLHGEKNFTSVERRSARPTLEINGLTSGYQGEGSKTIVPAEASAKITCRLVPDQDPKKIVMALKAQLQTLCPDTVRMEFDAGHGGRPYYNPPDGPMVKAALNALKFAFKAEPVLMREGGSIPIVNEFKTVLGVDTLLLGLGLPDDNVHSPNEKFDLRSFHNGIQMATKLWRELGLLEDH